MSFLLGRYTPSPSTPSVQVAVTLLGVYLLSKGLEIVLRMVYRPREEDAPATPARALIFDSEFDQYRGVIAYVRVVDGALKKGDAILQRCDASIAIPRAPRRNRPTDGIILPRPSRFAG